MTITEMFLILKIKATSKPCLLQLGKVFPKQGTKLKQKNMKIK